MNWFPDRSTVCLAEVPGEISLSIVLAGCSHKCCNCHSEEYQDIKNGAAFDWEQYGGLLLKYRDKCSCIVFFNGEYDAQLLIRLSWLARMMSYKTALYSGFEMEQLSEELKKEFSYIKVGSYREELGGLDSPTTNQRMLKKVDGEFVDITEEFRR